MPAVAAVETTAVLARLGAAASTWSLGCVAATGSTNADLAAAARAGAPEGTVLVAEHQRRGRGRFERAWVDVPGAGIAMSVLLRPRREAASWGWLPLLAGLALADALGGVGGIDVVLKWPNDILVESGAHPGKLCGILATLEPTADGPACVLGMGINVGQDRDELPVPTATSLALCGGSLDKSALVAAVLEALGQWYARWSAGEDLREAYVARCGTVGREVRVQLDAERGLGTTTVGLVTGVDADGSLLVRGADGAVLAVSAGDAIHVR